MTCRFDLFVPRLYGNQRQKAAASSSADNERPARRGRSKGGAFRTVPAPTLDTPAGEPAEKPQRQKA